MTSPASLLLSDGFFLARDGALGPTTCSCIGVGALALHRQITAMAHGAIAADFDQPLDVHIDFAAQVALDCAIPASSRSYLYGVPVISGHESTLRA